jgi:large subunit ribosomal protein L13
MKPTSKIKPVTDKKVATIKVRPTVFKTFSAKPSDITRQWHLLDASEMILGRLSTKAATLLTGKGKPIYTHHIDCGDYVVIVNADKLVVSGNKLADKMYYRHSEYPGNLKQATLTEKIAKDSCEVIRLAIKGMLPKNKLMVERLKRLKIYQGEQHDHTAQTPKKVAV